MANMHASAGAEARKQSTKRSCAGERHLEIAHSNFSNGAARPLPDGSGYSYMHTQLKPQRDNFLPPSLPRAHLQQQGQGLLHQALPHITPQTRPCKQSHLPASAVTEILPYCTTEPPLRQDQVIVLSDIAGSVKELVLLALGAEAGDAGCAEKMEGAVGADTTGRIVEFFAAEWEVE